MLFLAGEDAGPRELSAYVPAYELATNLSSISATVHGVAESSLVIDSFFKLHNSDARSHAVTLTATPAANSYVQGYAIAIYEASGAPQATLDLATAAPTASFVVPPGATFSARLTLTLASGAGADNVALTTTIALVA